MFVEKVRDTVGLYLNPPDHAVVLRVDENSKISGLERTQPMLPMGFGYADSLTHDYKRHGRMTLFAALDNADGRVMTQCKAPHRGLMYQCICYKLRSMSPRWPEMPTSLCYLGRNQRN